MARLLLSRREIIMRHALLCEHLLSICFLRQDCRRRLWWTKLNLWRRGALGCGERRVVTLSAYVNVIENGAEKKRTFAAAIAPMRPLLVAAHPYPRAGRLADSLAVHTAREIEIYDRYSCRW